MRHVAILTGPETHLDHLGVLSAVLEIPLVVTEEKNLLFSKEFYPDLNAKLIDLHELSLEHLAHNYDVIFETGKFFAAELKPFLQLLYGKSMRFVFCPHGNSDKGHSLKEHVEQDISLVYGDHLQDLLKANGASEKISHLVRTGNYRYSYYLKHRAFFDALAEEKVFCRFNNKKPVILYAPTWSDRENPSVFLTEVERLIAELSSSYHLLIKLHPFLIEDHPAHLYHLMARYENHSSVLFLTDFPPIYPLLARCDLYLGDYSSIGYDFLAFDKPLYFLGSKGDSSSPLHSCGLEVPLEAGDLNAFLAATLPAEAEFSKRRKKVYAYAFGAEVDLPQVKNEIISVLQPA
jgi:hypothetical protein